MLKREVKYIKFLHLILVILIILNTFGYESGFVAVSADNGVISTSKNSYVYGDELKNLDTSYASDIYEAMLKVTTESEKIRVYFDKKIPLEGTTYSDALLLNNETIQSLNNNAQTAIDAFVKDFPEVFWIDFGKSLIKVYFSSSTDSAGVTSWYITSIGLEFTNLDTISDASEAYSQVITEINEIVSRASGKSDYEKMKYYHDYLCTNIDYVTDADNCYDIYGALVNGESVCEGYAESFKVLCDVSGINCILVRGNAATSSGNAGSHMWNYCRMNDGKWYAVDVTWDDQPQLKQKIIYDYFLCGSNTYSKITYNKFSESHISDGDFSETGIYSFTYPVLNINAYDPDENIVTETPTPAPTETPTPKPTSTPTPEPITTLTPEPTATLTPKPTATLTPGPTSTPEPTATTTSTSTFESTETPQPTVTPTPVISSSESPVLILYKLGDVNDDAYIDSADALSVLKVAARIYLPDSRERLAADVDENKVIDSADALLILKLAAKLINEL